MLSNVGRVTVSGNVDWVGISAPALEVRGVLNGDGMGFSGGGCSPTGWQGGAGGAAIRIEASTSVVSGAITANGSRGSDNAGYSGGPVDAWAGLQVGIESPTSLRTFGAFEDRDGDGVLVLEPAVPGDVCGMSFATVELRSCSASEPASF